MAAQKRTPRPIGVLIALASVLGALNLGLVSLWLSKVACGPRFSLVKKEVVVEKRKFFWKRRERVVETEPTPEPASPFCQTVWNVLDQMPLLTTNEQAADESQETETCVEENVKRNPLQKLFSKLKRRNKNKTTSSSSSTALDLREFPTAYSTDFHATNAQEKLMHRLAHEFRVEMNETTHTLDHRLDSVAWGGSSHTKWWQGHDGGPLLASYLRIMGWPQDLLTNFPMKLCGNEKCHASFALQHTLQWRESFKPWLMCPGAMEENKNGFVYFRGHAKSLNDKKTNHGHGMVWLRAAAHGDSSPDPIWYFRALLNALDMAVSDSLHRSHQKVGKFNVVIDAAGASFQMLPKLGDAKKGIVMLQDHYPNRLGIIVLANFSRVSEFLLTMIKPLITKEVRDKILILPKDPIKRQAILETIIEKEYIPDYLGGTDTYRFDVKEYYADTKLHCTDAQAKEYLTTMPYHA